MSQKSGGLKNEAVLHTVKEERNVLRKIKRGKAKGIGHILRRTCFLKHIFEGKIKGKIEVTGRGETAPG
jgi:hypothetical protein